VQEQVACRKRPKNGTSNTTSIRRILFGIFSDFSVQFRLFSCFKMGHIAGNNDVQEQVACSKKSEKWYCQYNEHTKNPVPYIFCIRRSVSAFSLLLYGHIAGYYEGYELFKSCDPRKNGISNTNSIWRILFCKFSVQ
jgi:hypothetical protein